MSYLTNRECRALAFVVIALATGLMVKWYRQTSIQPGLSRAAISAPHP